MHRRTLLAALTAASFAPGLALADVRRVPLSKAFDHLDLYEQLPPGLKSRWYLMYVVKRGDRLAPDVHPVMVLANGQRVPLQVDPAAQVLNAPGPVTLRSSAYLEIDSSAHLVGEIRASTAPSTHIEAATLVAALAQVTQALVHLAGFAAALVPKFDFALFPDSAGGAAVRDDGSTTPLPLITVRGLGQAPCFQASDSDGITAVTFDRAPSRIVLSPKPKS